MGSLLIIVLVLSGVAIIGLVLIQHGKGADMGASFGSGASQTVFGSAGTGNVLTKSTTWLAIVFFAACLGLAWMARNRANAGAETDALLADPTVVKAATAASGDKAKESPAATQPAGDIPAAQPQANQAQPTQSQPAQSEVPAAPAPAPVEQKK